MWKLAHNMAAHHKQSPLHTGKETQRALKAACSTRKHASMLPERSAEKLGISCGLSARNSPTNCKMQTWSWKKRMWRADRCNLRFADRLTQKVPAFKSKHGGNVNDEEEEYQGPHQSLARQWLSRELSNCVLPMGDPLTSPLIICEWTALH